MGRRLTAAATLPPPLCLPGVACQVQDIVTAAVIAAEPRMNTDFKMKVPHRNNCFEVRLPPTDQSLAALACMHTAHNACANAMLPAYRQYISSTWCHSYLPTCLFKTQSARRTYGMGLWHGVWPPAAFEALACVVSGVGAIVRGLTVRSAGLQVWGFDIMLDDDLRAWLIEVNTCPSLAADSPMDVRVKGAMVAGLMHLVGPVPYDTEVRAWRGSGTYCCCSTITGSYRGRRGLKQHTHTTSCPALATHDDAATAVCARTC